jgi:hypothetical protein
MTPEEQKLVDALFDRLARLENAARDPDADRSIAAGLQRAPHAVYALVQTVLVQDEALKRANARIEELEAQLGGEEPPQRQQASFLDTMRDVMLGRPPQPTGVVPRVRPQSAPVSPPPGREPPIGYGPQSAAPGYPPQPPFPPGPAFGGGSFLGAAASTAAGVVGGSLLLDGIRSMFGRHAGLGAVDPPGGLSSRAGHDELAHDLGIDHIGHAGDADKPAAEPVADVPDDTDDQYLDDADYADDGGYDDESYDA